MDGKPAEVFPADIALTGIALPSGIHTVELVFRPTTFIVGAGLTLSAAFIIACLSIVDFRKRASWLAQEFEPLPRTFSSTKNI